MNLYHCSIDLKDDAKAVPFAASLSQWMDYLKAAGTIEDWQLLRRKLGFGGPRARDFVLLVQCQDLAQLDRAFRLTGSGNEDVERLHAPVHAMIGSVDFALYRPFPDPERAERMALL